MDANIIIPRNYYLNQLINCKHNGFIKIVTGMRRSGKSFLLNTLFHNYLIEQDIAENHIIELSLDEVRNNKLHAPEALLDYLESQLQHDGNMNYIILDEIQLVDNFVGVLLTLMHMRNVDVYVSGSNSKFLSKDVVTEFRGRGYEIHVYPLSFAEFYSAVGGDKYACWREFCRYGGLPQILKFDSAKEKEGFLKQIQQTVYLKDLIERCKIKGEAEFQELYWIMASCIGSPCNPNKLANTYNTVKGEKLDNKTIANYLTYMEDAFLLERAMRYDIKGKRYINSLSKYYFQDIGLRNAAIGFRQFDESHIMENIIYNELRIRGYRVDVGVVEVWKKEDDKRKRQPLEVDFVAEQGDKRYYIQSALEMPTLEKQEQEKASLRNIQDGFKRVIIVRSDMLPYYDEDGFLIVGLFDFLLSPDVLEK